MPKHVTYIISRIDKSVGFEALFDKLRNDGLSFDVVLLNPGESYLKQYLAQQQHAVTELRYSGKKDMPRVLRQLLRHFKVRRPAIVHTHLLDAGLLGGLAAWIRRVPLRVYTRHHGDMHFYEQRRGRFYDRLIHSFYNRIIALSTGHLHLLNDREGLAKKTVLIPNFYDEQLFSVSEARLEAAKSTYGFSEQHLAIGVNARWTAWKGVRFAIEGFRQFLSRHPQAKLYLFNANGDDSDAILNALHQLPEGSYRYTAFEHDMMAVYPHFDYFVHVPVRETAESFGLVYIEAMGSGLPCVFTLSGIACDAVTDKVNAMVVPYHSGEAVAEALETLIEDTTLREQLAAKAGSVTHAYTLSTHIAKLHQLYTSMP